MTDIRIALDQWDGDYQGNLMTWIFEDGASVSEGDVVAEIMIEKTQVDMIAPRSGVLFHAAVENDLVRKGDLIGRIE
ncbi:MAG: biotin/lipoyl-containing protein [Sphingomonadaceae bacterium]